MTVRVSAPATLSNIGPGFDVLGLALETPLDSVTVELREQPGIVVASAGPFGERIPLDPARNLAAFAAERVLLDAGHGGGLLLTVEKVIPPGSGLGSSAASAVAAMVATSRALGRPIEVQRLLEVGREAEALAAGSAHLDNVAPSLLGGFVAVTQTHPPVVRRLAIPNDWWFAVVLPDYPVETKGARALLPREVPLSDAIGNLRDLAALIDAAGHGDLPSFAAHLRDRLAAPYRAPLWPFFEPAKQAALAAGALALSVSGSGPAMFAPCATEGDAERIAARVVAGLSSAGFGGVPYVSRVSSKGAMA